MTTKQEFEDFLDEQIQEEEKITVDWKKIKKDWIKDIHVFYNFVNELLVRYIESGKVSIKYTTCVVHEERLGSYNAKNLILTLGQQQVNFTPIGRLIFGAQGRIDMEGTSGKVKFIFTENNYKDEAITISIPTEDDPNQNSIQT